MILEQSTHFTEALTQTQNKPFTSTSNYKIQRCGGIVWVHVQKKLLEIPADASGPSRHHYFMP